VSWAQYWNQETSLYVSERHRRLHYESITREIIAYLPAGEVDLLDYGCGDTLAAAKLADASARLLLCDLSPRVRQRLAARYADRGDITVIAPQDFEALAAHSLGMIVVNSVAQYLSKSQFEHLLAQAQAKLKPGGVLLLADIVPPEVGPVRDALELIKFAAAAGFLLPALFGLARSYFSSYRQIRRRSGFLQFKEAEMVQLLRRHGFTAQRQPRNIGHNAQRMTFLAVKP